MTLGEKQRLFAMLVGKLITEIYAHGYSVTFGDAFRSEVEAKRLGFVDSNHTKRLAIDLNLFNREGHYMTQSDAHEPFGRFWKSLHPLTRWGGDFLDSRGRPKPDGNHYSLFHDGVA